ncbi:hypothetical protein GE061_007782 [Apolygus lucorum]|uniref:Uncharacterized protein n=1 Tax=Apolygus lucorum TaxID=248454 RepID=A0A8S9WMS5_APOLU|nr:hypothetical protein GE061_007782 [Apolygus lucorum]
MHLSIVSQTGEPITTARDAMRTKKIMDQVLNKLNDVGREVVHPPTISVGKLPLQEFIINSLKRVKTCYRFSIVATIRSMVTEETINIWLPMRYGDIFEEIWEDFVDLKWYEKRRIKSMDSREMWRYAEFRSKHQFQKNIQGANIQGDESTASHTTRVKGKGRILNSNFVKEIEDRLI